MKHIIVLVLAALLSACGLIDDKMETFEMDMPAVGEERVAGGWRCVADEAQRWVCEDEAAASASQATPAASSEAVAEKAVVADAPDIESAEELAVSDSSEIEPAEKVTVLDAPAIEAAGEVAVSVAPEIESAENAAVAVESVAESGEKPSPSAAVSAASDTTVFVLQVGSYRELGSASAYVDETGLENAEILHTAGENGDWYVVIVGEFNAFSAAKQGGEAFLQQHPGHDYWIRNRKELNIVSD